MWLAGSKQDGQGTEPLGSERKQEALRMLMRTLSTIDKGDALEKLVTQVSRFGLSRSLRLCIVLDTSFLMLERTPDIWEWLSSCPRRGLETVYSIPSVVIAEVARHFGTDKDQPARVARKRIAQLVGKSAEIEQVDHIPSIERADAMSADSDADRQIISLASAKADDNQFLAVILATDDGGIMYDVAKLRRAGKRITFVSKESTADDIFEFICPQIAESSTDDAFLRLVASSRAD